MSRFDFYRNQFSGTSYNGLNTVSTGSQLKLQSDISMEESWWNDPQSKVAYIYDFAHDSEPDKNYGITYFNTTKTKVDIKFIVTERGSLSKDQPSAKIMFKPSMKTWGFTEADDLYYAQLRAEKYGMTEAFCGLYIDIPDEKGVYRKWMICLQDIQGNQFQKYFVLPCDYKLQWMRLVGNKRIKQQMWSVLRSQSSYKQL